MTPAPTAQPLVAALNERIDAVLGPLVDAGAPVAIVGYPNHPNVGDAAIYAGEVAWLGRRGIRVAYACDLDSYRADVLAARLGDRGTILLHGGGNLGDLWVDHQELRERTIRDFPGHRIVSFPQTMHFRDPAALDRARAVFDGHRDLHLLLRDQRSLDAARDAFAASAALSPDMAFALRSVPRRAPARTPIVWLAREDDEREGGRLLPDDPTVRVVDWLDEIQAPMRPRERRARGFATRVGRAVVRRPPPVSALAGLQVAACAALATERVAYGRALLEQGDVLVTDRLHGHIVATLMDLPHVLVDTGYGKLRTFHEAFTATSPLTRMATSADDALNSARALVAARG
ncbi:Putative pyruvyl transferase EpsO [Baekduia alba]|uniref:polysaccharide pyruvyl transferase family protein n=1 Tax=Baekduia alba TaxID=2997333 RepID=UPI0023406398|nr:polysaccharide pyruvyl transferase family protein [Baekduia alba]WCB96952.1 Putative pyruvyl transferase EpsO [Baekduia alba]